MTAPIRTIARAPSARRRNDELGRHSTQRLAVEPIDTSFSFKNKAYDALKQAIVTMKIYDAPGELRLDERQLAKDFGVSRTPIREAMQLLEQEGFVRTIPRRGIFVVRKKRYEVIEMITVWAALESMAARLITARASDADIARLRRMFATFEGKKVQARLNEYSEANINFHQTIIMMSGCDVLIKIAENLFTHMRMIRGRTIGENQRAIRSMQDHMAIIEALERRDTKRAEDLVRQHALDLADHVARHATYLD
ncbi:MAG TPA: GntR family transcriptional regulator [Alphaproteobacteria bacterium]|nr:GntR family transcriptional regulator [Alphaproteobacteria bacterium]